MGVMNLTPFRRLETQSKNIDVCLRKILGTTGTLPGRWEGLQGHFQGDGGHDKDTTAQSVGLLVNEPACHNANLKTTFGLKKQVGRTTNWS
jgi:hypothetical protein